MELPRLFLELAIQPNWATEQLGKKDLGQGGDQEPNDHSDRTTEFLGWDWRTCRKDNSLCSTSQIEALWESGQAEVTPEKKAHDSMSGVCKKARESLWEHEVKYSVV